MHRLQVQDAAAPEAVQAVRPIPMLCIFTRSPWPPASNSAVTRSNAVPRSSSERLRVPLARRVTCLTRPCTAFIVATVFPCRSAARRGSSGDFRVPEPIDFPNLLLGQTLCEEPHARRMEYIREWTHGCVRHER